MRLDQLWRHCLAFLLIIWFVVKKGAALNCYQCDSTHDPDCKEWFDHEHFDTLTVRSTECTVDSATYCIKTTGVWGGIVGTTRFCSSRDMGNQCQFVEYPDHDRIYRACIYTCSGNDCNGAATASVSIVSLLFTSLFALCNVWS